jgi:hypothetical protein
LNRVAICPLSRRHVEGSPTIGLVLVAFPATQIKSLLSVRTDRRRRLDTRLVQAGQRGTTSQSSRSAIQADGQLYYRGVRPSIQNIARLGPVFEEVYPPLSIALSIIGIDANKFW